MIYLAAPYTRARVLTQSRFRFVTLILAAPYTRARVETGSCKCSYRVHLAAPYTRARVLTKCTRREHIWLCCTLHAPVEYWLSKETRHNSRVSYCALFRSKQLFPGMVLYQLPGESVLNRFIWSRFFNVSVIFQKAPYLKHSYNWQLIHCVFVVLSFQD